jgi:predicted RNA binding protein YcfA (HicA-like mRNA interferase family)
MGDFSPDVKKILKANGCYWVRPGKGDHEIWFSPITERHVIIDNKILSRHTTNAIMKQAGLGKQF